MEAPYNSEEERMRLLDLYRYMHSRIHSSSRPLKLIYHVAERETLLAWVCTVSCCPRTRVLGMYCTLLPRDSCPGYVLYPAAQGLAQIMRLYVFFIGHVNSCSA